MAGENKLMQLAQYAGGGSPYDEEAYMPNSSDYIGRGNMAYNPRARAMGYGDSPANTFLNDRLYERYMGGGGPSPYGGGGTDYDLQMRYGPNGAPQDPMPPQPYNSYPQRRSEEDVKARIIRELMK